MAGEPKAFETNPLLPPLQLGPQEEEEDRELTALIVEDDRDAAFVTHGYLQQLGVRAVIARTVDDALPLLRGFRPDFVLLDLHLPGRSGTELVEACRQAGIDVEGVRFVATTGVYARKKGLNEHLARWGIDTLLNKPFQREQLAAVLGIDLGLPTESASYRAPAGLARGRVMGALFPLSVRVERVRGPQVVLGARRPLQGASGKLSLHLPAQAGHPELPLVYAGRLVDQIEVSRGDVQITLRLMSASNADRGDTWLRRLSRR
jgi:CheY-like chemotaxis protein